MNKQIIIFLALVVSVFSCKIKKEVKADPIKAEPVVEVRSNDKVDLNLIKGNYYITAMELYPDFNEVIPTVKIGENGSIGGNNGCNAFFGQINIEKDNLINNLGATRRACPGEGGEVERMIMATLKTVTNITAEGFFIHFYSDEKIVISGKRITLEGGNWEVTSIEGRKYSQMPSFNVDNNRMNGTTGCNSFFAMVKQNGFDLKFIESGITEMDCPEFDMTMESKFMQCVGKITSFKRVNGMTIFYGQEKELFRALNPEQE